MSDPTHFHGLKLLTHCGGGAFGEVWYCEDISGRKLAVKILSKKKLGADWERELRGVINYRKITENTPDLLQIFHVEEDEEAFFYTMEPADSATENEYSPDTLGNRLLLSRLNCTAHLKNCPECSRLLEELEQDDKFLKDLKESCRLFRELARPGTRPTER